MMLYKPNLEETLERYNAFWDGEMQNRILCRINVRENKIERDPFMKNVPDIEKMYTDFENYVKAKQRVEDDSFPVICPNFGTGIIGGYLGEEVKFGYGTSQCKPILKDYGQLSRIKFDLNNHWINEANRCLRYYCERGKDKLAVGMIDTGGAIDFALVWRGSSQLPTDFYDHPQELHLLLDFATDFIINLVEGQLAIVGKFKGGIFTSWLGWWAPGKPISISGDEFVLCSPSLYNEFGLPYDQRLIDHFGGGWYYLHSAGLHILPEVVKLKNLIGIQISMDPNSPSPFTKLTQIKKIIRDIPLDIDCTYKEFLNGLENHTLAGNVLYSVWGESYSTVPLTVEKANELLRKIKRQKYR